MIYDRGKITQVFAFQNLFEYKSNHSFTGPFSF